MSKQPELWDAGYRAYWANRENIPARMAGLMIARDEELKVQPPGPWSAPDRRRRSRIDWAALLDDTVLVNRQEGFERNATVLAMRDAGLSRGEIAERIGVTRSRVAQMIDRGERQRGKGAPIEEFLRYPWGLDDVAAVRAVGVLGRLRKGDWRAP